MRGDKGEKQPPEKRIEERAKRVSDLSQKLKEKLKLFTNAFPIVGGSVEDLEDKLPFGTTVQHMSAEALSSFRVVAELEAEDLRKESHGVDLLNAIGYTYTLKADQWNASIDAEKGDIFERAWGFGGRFTGAVREKYHIIADTAGTLRTAMELHQLFSKLKLMEKQRQELGTPITPEEQNLKAQLENEAATKGMKALWRGTKLEIEAVLRQVCDEVLGDPKATVEMRRRRVSALRVLGEVFSAVSPEKTEDVIP
jgi:hypothetical protein